MLAAFHPGFVPSLNRAPENAEEHGQKSPIIKQKMKIWHLCLVIQIETCVISPYSELVGWQYVQIKAQPVQFNLKMDQDRLDCTDCLPEGKNSGNKEL